MTAKPRKEIERILTGAAMAARQLVDAEICSVLTMDNSDRLIFVTVGGDSATISPSQLGRALEKLGGTLQGRAPGDGSDVEIVKRTTTGVQPLALDEPFSAHGDLAMADAQDDGGGERQPHPDDQTNMTSGQVVTLLALAEKAGRMQGRAAAYADVLGSAAKRLKEKQEDLMRIGADAPSEQLVMGEIMAYRVLLDAFNGAVDHYTQAHADTMDALASYAVAEKIAAIVPDADNAPG
jgi:hypothetical protein